MAIDTHVNHANEVRRLRDIIGKVTRERDALQQQVYDLAARNAELERRLNYHHERSLNIIHDQGARIIDLEAKLANG